MCEIFACPAEDRVSQTADQTRTLRQRDEAARFDEAQRVVVLTVQGGTVPGPTGEQLARHLERNGVPCEPVTVAPGGRSTGEAILANAAARNCDLLIKGAYTQSRLRQMIFGGTTRHILSNTELPVLMAH